MATNNSIAVVIAASFALSQMALSSVNTVTSYVGIAATHRRGGECRAFYFLCCGLAETQRHTIGLANRVHGRRNLRLVLAAAQGWG